MQTGPRPVDHAEAVALFRVKVLGDILSRDLERGERAIRLRALSEQRFRPPGSDTTRCYGISTLERWYYDYRREGLDGLRPKPRSDRGHARALTPAQQRLIVDIAREHPNASAAVIVRTLETDGRIDEGSVSVPTVRRLLREHGLTDRRAPRPERLRRKWEMASCGELWHADVCHGPPVIVDGTRKPVRIHAILDDHSRYVVALEVCHTEREVDMLMLCARAVRLSGRPRGFYLDNGSTYTGEALATACGRLDIRLTHAKPYDPQARGKMERFWRTMREQVLDHIGECHSLHDILVRLLAWLDRHYHVTPHAGLMGKTPLEVWTNGRGAWPKLVTEADLDRALTVRERRRVQSDGTLSVGGVAWELVQGFLVRQLVTVARSMLHPTRPPWVEHQGRRYLLHPVDAVANSRRSRPAFKPKPGVDAIPFDPAGVLLDRAMGRLHRPEDVF